MRYRTAALVVTMALALPAFGQHGGSHGGFSSHGGSMGHSGFAGHSSFSGSRGFSGRTSAPHYGGGYSRPGFARPTMPMRSGFGIPYRGLAQHRPPYRPGFDNRYRGWDRDHDRWRRGWYAGAYGYGYPGWGYGYPYPYVIDPGFYDWGDPGDSEYDQNSAENSYPPYTDYAQPYPDPPPSGYAQPQYPQQPYPQAPAAGSARPAYSGSAAAAPAEEPLTLIFKNGRAPQTMRNYMMNANALTDMDPQHYEQIPLDEIDVAATTKLNRTHGVDFQVPGAVRN